MYSEDFIISMVLAMLVFKQRRPDMCLFVVTARNKSVKSLTNIHV